MDLNEIRKQIDVIDREIVELYEKRMHLTTQVAEYKIETGKNVYDRERELSKLEAVESLIKNDDNDARHGIRELFEQIMSISRKKQYKLIGEKRAYIKSPCNWVDVLPKNNKTIVFQGVDGAYSQAAMFKYFGKDCNNYAVSTWRDAMEALKLKKADYAVLPIENSTAGEVEECFDLIAEYDHHIMGEVVLPIDHVLVGLKGTKLSDVKTIYSHHQALMQCSEFIDKNGFDYIPLKNTALAAKKIKDDGNPDQAAIANRLTAEIYDLEILQEDITNLKNNSTRFVVVGVDETYENKANKISICIELVHESGSLYHALSNFIFNGINLTQIVSHPIPGRNWEYRFFIDFEGNLKDANVRNAVYGIMEEAKMLKVLGNYYSETNI